MKKGQAALEFLMTYGWAILVVLAAIGALAYFGVLSPDKFLPDKCIANPPFSCNQYKVYSTGSVLSLGLQNNAGVDLTGVTVAVTCSGGTTATVSAGNGLTNAIILNGNPVNGTPGGHPMLNVTCGDIGARGSKYKASYTVTYTKSGETVSHTSTGTIQTRVE